MNRSVQLFIDTSSSEKTEVRIIIDGTTNCFVKEKSKDRSQAVLPLIIEGLETHSLLFQDLTEVVVCQGPGSFTGLRVGMAVGSMIAWYFGIPLNGNDVSHGLPPLDYGNDPWK